MMKFFRNLFSPLTPRQVASYYENWTERYIDGFGEIFQAKQATTPEQLAAYYLLQMELKPGMHLLDAGCGIGGPAIHIAKQIDVTIDAVTISPKQAAIAREKVKAAGLEHRIRVIEADFHTMTQQFPAQAYDIVYFMESLVHSATPQKAIREAWTLLKPDGAIYIKDLFEKTAYSPAEHADIRHWVKHNNKHIRLNILPKEEVLTLLRRQFFQLDFCQLMKIPTNQDLGNVFVVKNGIMPDPIANSLPPYLEWYEMRAIKPGPRLVDKM